MGNAIVEVGADEAAVPGPPDLFDRGFGVHSTLKGGCVILLDLKRIFWPDLNTWKV